MTSHFDPCPLCVFKAQQHWQFVDHNLHISHIIIIIWNVSAEVSVKSLVSIGGSTPVSVPCCGTCTVCSAWESQARCTSAVRLALIKPTSWGFQVVDKAYASPAVLKILTIQSPGWFMRIGYYIIVPKCTQYIRNNHNIHNPLFESCQPTSAQGFACLFGGEAVSEPTSHHTRLLGQGASRIFFAGRSPGVAFAACWGTSVSFPLQQIFKVSNGQPVPRTGSEMAQKGQMA